MRRLLALTLCSAVACAAGSANAPAPEGAAARPALPKRYSDAEIAALVFADGDNPVRSCVGSAVRTQFGLAAMKLGRASPERVHDALVGTLTDPTLVAWRERQFAQWQKDESPSKVAVVLLNDCLPARGVEFTFLRIAGQCLDAATTPADFALVWKRGKVPLETAKARQREAFKASGLKEPLLLGIVDAIYAAPDDDAEFRVVEKLFGGCVKALGDP